MITVISSAVMAIVMVIAAIIAIIELKEILKSRKYTVFMDLTRFLQQDDIRDARSILLGLSGIDFKNWTKEEIKAAEKVCMSYNFLGEVVSTFIEEDLVIPGRRDSIIKCWKAAEPMLVEYRKKRGDVFWNDFDRLYKLATEFETSVT